MIETIYNRIREINIMLDEGAYVPERAHDADAGYDLRTRERAELPAGDSVTIDTGVHMEIPRGYVGILKSKSGLNVKHGITGTGTIDSGYTGSIRVKLYNDSSEPHIFEKGDKIIQIVLFPIFTPDLHVVDSLANTERGDGGFGSSGR